MYANVKLHYTELQQRRLAALEMCSTAKDMVTGPTGETRLVLPSSELRDCRPSGFRSATKCIRHLRIEHIHVLLPGYLRRFRAMHAYKSYIFEVSRSEGRATQRLPVPRGGTTTSRERIINIFISGFLYVFTFIYKDGSTSICSVLADCSAWSRKCSLR